MSMITWLHVSDLHFKADELNSWNEDIVLRALLEDVAERIEKDNLRPDFIAVTGDLAFSGKPAEYDLARRFFDDLLETTGLGKDRLFPVPGNHDVDRSLVSPLVGGVVATLTNRESINKILADTNSRRAMLVPLGGYANFINDYLGEYLTFDDEHSFYVRRLELAGQGFALLGLNSAWLAGGGDKDHNELALGERQVRSALAAAKDAEFKIALLHHPFQCLSDFDRQDNEPLLTQACDFILHGHRQRTGLILQQTPDSQAVVIAAGADYETRQSGNAYNLVCLDLNAGQGIIHLRAWSDRGGGFWAKDVQTYRNADYGQYIFPIFRQITYPKTSSVSVDHRSKSSRSTKKVTLLHLSDLQFGRHHTNLGDREPLYKDERSYGDELAKLQADVSRVKIAYDISPDFIVITGDIAEWSLKSEYQKANKFLLGIADICKIPRRRVLMVPGNHDINRDLCQGERLIARGREEELPRENILFRKFENYQRFFDDFYRDTAGAEDTDCPKFTDKLYVVYAFPEFRILFAGLNSCVRESEREEDHYGCIEIDQLTKAIEVCEQEDPKHDFLRVAFCHHNYRQGSNNDQENLRDASELEYPLLHAGFKMILHGHQHIPQALVSGSGRYIHVLATGSAGLDGSKLPDNARRYQYIVIEDGKVNVYRRRFESQIADTTGQGCWVPDPLPEDSKLRGKDSATLAFRLYSEAMEL